MDCKLSLKIDCHGYKTGTLSTVHVIHCYKINNLQNITAISRPLFWSKVGRLVNTVTVKIALFQNLINCLDIHFKTPTSGCKQGQCRLVVHDISL